MALPDRQTAPLFPSRMAAAGLMLSLLSGCADQDLHALFDPLKQGLTSRDATLNTPDAGRAAQATEPDALPQPAASASAKAPPAAVPVAESAQQPPQSASLPRPRVAALRTTTELVGLDSTMVEQRLGTPALRRRDAPAELWQYRSPLCVMDLFLYSDGRGFKVTHVELRSRTVEQVQAPTCLASFGEPAKPPPTSG